ncbi:MAG TPA: hypothetical protein VMG99_08745 [Thermoplasmata archaeon]|nr:hypothetical protein [Thermoplasmata archaeon]
MANSSAVVANSAIATLARAGGATARSQVRLGFLTVSTASGTGLGSVVFNARAILAATATVQDSGTTAATMIWGAITSISTGTVNVISVVDATSPAVGTGSVGVLAVYT